MRACCGAPWWAGWGVQGGGQLGAGAAAAWCGPARGGKDATCAGEDAAAARGRRRRRRRGLPTPPGPVTRSRGRGRRWGVPGRLFAAGWVAPRGVAALPPRCPPIGRSGGRASERGELPGGAARAGCGAPCWTAACPPPGRSPRCTRGGSGAGAGRAEGSANGAAGRVNAGVAAAAAAPSGGVHHHPLESTTTPSPAAALQASCPPIAARHSSGHVPWRWNGAVCRLPAAAQSCPGAARSAPLEPQRKLPTPLWSTWPRVPPPGLRCAAALRSGGFVSLCHPIAAARRQRFVPSTRFQCR